MLFDHAHTLYDVGEMELFSTRQQRYLLGGQEILEVAGYFLGHSLWIIVLREISIG